MQETETRPATLTPGEGEGGPVVSKPGEGGACLAEAGSESSAGEGGSGTRALVCHERADGRYRSRIQHVRRFDPAAPGGADAELHLTGEAVDAVAVAVDRDGHAGGGGPPRDLAVHVEVARRAVHFHGRARCGGGGKEAVEIEAVAARPCRRPVRG